MKRVASSEARREERGFTLVEVLIATVVLVFGLIGISNLLLVGASSNSVANRGAAATTAAVETMERLKATAFGNLAVGGNLTGSGCVSGAFSRCDDIAGVGRISTRWQVTQIDTQLLFVHVRSEALGVLGGVRTRTDLTAFRSCTAPQIGCPTVTTPATP